ncbi:MULTISPECIES: MarR family winged helix-turn-helix transcriptional regulator [Niveibacterium]|uniref:MarR family transcriptional regulator n=1 Tax=Niveibacterium microcysteis TaxID=2811415 RepID=A0ABX7M7P1_9RHOO|nr:MULTISPECIES: MarR family transcriptional regulator [Niveibacterium]QSI76480.1 MarR family transcriptional regulator [Niveibacterium microcysteis]
MTHTATPADVLRRFRIVFNAVRTHFQQVEMKTGLGGAQVWALSLVRDHPGIGIGELARRMDIHQSTASNLVKTLVKRELIAVARGESDRRSVALKILAAGQLALGKVPGPFEGVLPDALERLPQPTLDRLDEDLRVLINALQADEEAGRIPLGRS